MKVARWVGLTILAFTVLPFIITPILIPLLERASPVKSPATSVENLAVTSYGYTGRARNGSSLMVATWHVRIKNNAAQRASDLYIAFDWLDKNGERLAYANKFTNLGAAEELTITDDMSIEKRLYDQVAQIGITFSMAGERRYQIFPRRETMPVSGDSYASLLPVIYGGDTERAMQAARQYMIGTWTYTGTGGAGWFWEKWEVFADGMMNAHSTLPTANNWGPPDTKEWEILTDKYADTGKRYFAFHIKGEAVHAVILEDGRVFYRMPDGDLPMERGDKFPFSK